MQKGKYAYAAAGVQAPPGMRMNVRSHVLLPDAEAGCAGEDRQPYHATRVLRREKGQVTISRNVAALLLGALFAVFGVLTVTRTIRRAALSKAITGTENAIVQIEQDNVLLAWQVEQARDEARIAGEARNYGLTSSRNATPVWVTAPDTRPFEQKTKAQAATSPVSALDAIITGSR